MPASARKEQTRRELKQLICNVIEKEENRKMLNKQSEHMTNDDKEQPLVRFDSYAFDMPSSNLLEQFLDQKSILVEELLRPIQLLFREHLHVHVQFQLEHLMLKMNDLWTFDN